MKKTLTAVGLSSFLLIATSNINSQTMSSPESENVIKENYTWREKDRIKELKKWVKRRNWKQKEKVDSVFNHEKFGLDNAIKEIFERDTSLFDTFEEYKEFVNYQNLVDSANIVFEEYKWWALQVYKKNNWDPRIGIGHTGIETRYGKTLGSHKLPNAILSSHVYTKSNGRFKSSRRQFEAMFAYADSFYLSVNQLFSIPSSWAGASGDGQWMAGTAIIDFIDRNGEKSFESLFNFIDNLYAIENFYIRRGYKHGRNIDKIIKSYNKGKIYRLAVKGLIDAIPYYTVEELEKKVHDDFVKDLGKTKPREFEKFRPFFEKKINLRVPQRKLYHVRSGLPSN